MAHRKVARHETRLSMAHQGALDQQFSAGQRVRTPEGVTGRVLFVTESFSPGLEAYQVELDGGMGGGTYLGSQLRPLPEDYRGLPAGFSNLPAGVTSFRPMEAAFGSEGAFGLDQGEWDRWNQHALESAHLPPEQEDERSIASDDYPEMGTVLHDHPDPAHQRRVIGSLRKTALFAHDVSDEDLVEHMVNDHVANGAQSIARHERSGTMASGTLRKLHDDSHNHPVRDPHNREDDWIGASGTSTNPMFIGMRRTAAAGPDEGPFYHGSRYQFEPGHYLTVKDANQHAPNYSESTGRHLFFTTDRSVATDYAEPRHDDRTSVGHIYEVRPTSRYRQDPAESLGYPRDPTAYRTDRRLQVIRELGKEDMPSHLWARLRVNELHPNRLDSPRAHWCDNCTGPMGRGISPFEAYADQKPSWERGGSLHLADTGSAADVAPVANAPIPASDDNMMDAWETGQHGDAPQHGLIPRADDPDAYDAASTEGEPGPEESEDPWHPNAPPAAGGSGGDPDSSPAGDAGGAGGSPGDGGGFGGVGAVLHEARVPWTDAERANLHNFDPAPSATWGDFVPSSEFHRGPAEPPSLEEDPEQIQAEGALSREMPEYHDEHDLVQHLHHHHGSDPGSIEHHRLTGQLESLHRAHHDERVQLPGHADRVEHYHDPGAYRQAGIDYHSYSAPQPHPERNPGGVGDVGTPWMALAEDVATEAQHAGDQPRTRVMHTLSMRYQAAAENRGQFSDPGDHAAHLMNHHGWTQVNVDNALGRGNRLGDMHDALHSSGFANHRHTRAYTVTPDSPTLRSERGGYYSDANTRDRVMSAEPVRAVLPDESDPVRRARFYSSLAEAGPRAYIREAALSIILADASQKSNADAVFGQLAEDYPVDSMGWIHHVAWSGPHWVPFDDIDWDGRHGWNAYHQPARYDEFKPKVLKKLKKGKEPKPVILVQRPGLKDQRIIDGHHRSITELLLGQKRVVPGVWAWTGHVHSAVGPWDEFHAKQFRADHSTDTGYVPGDDGSTKPEVRKFHEKIEDAVARVHGHDGKSEPEFADLADSLDYGKKIKKTDEEKKRDEDEEKAAKDSGGGGKNQGLEPRRTIPNEGSGLVDNSVDSAQEVPQRSRAWTQGRNPKDVRRVASFNLRQHMREQHPEKWEGLKDWARRRGAGLIRAEVRIAHDWQHIEHDPDLGHEHGPEDHGDAYPYWDRGPDAFSQHFSKKTAFRMFTEAAKSPSFGFEFCAAWRDVVAKAKRLRSAGRVRITAVAAGYVIGEIGGDHDVYESGIQHYPGRPQSIFAWACGCPWASFHQDKSIGTRYAGRPCSHVMALKFEEQARRIHGRALHPDPQVEPLLGHQVVVKSLPPWGPGGWSQVWTAPSTIAPFYGMRRRADDEFVPAAEVADILRSLGVGRRRVASLKKLADQANAPWGSDNTVAHPPVKPYGATEPVQPAMSPASYGFLAGPDPENWGEIRDDSVTQIAPSTGHDAALHPENLPEHLRRYHGYSDTDLPEEDEDDRDLMEYHHEGEHNMPMDTPLTGARIPHDHSDSGDPVSHVTYEGFVPGGDFGPRGYQSLNSLHQASETDVMVSPTYTSPPPRDLGYANVGDWHEGGGTFPYADQANTAGPSISIEPRDPGGIRMEEKTRDPRSPARRWLLNHFQDEHGAITGPEGEDLEIHSLNELNTLHAQEHEAQRSMDEGRGTGDEFRYSPHKGPIDPVFGKVKKKGAGAGRGERWRWATEHKDDMHGQLAGTGHDMDWEKVNYRKPGMAQYWRGTCKNCGGNVTVGDSWSSCDSIGRNARDEPCTGPGTSWQNDLIIEKRRRGIADAVSQYGRDVKDAFDKQWLHEQGLTTPEEDADRRFLHEHGIEGALQRAIKTATGINDEAPQLLGGLGAELHDKPEPALDPEGVTAGDAPMGGADAAMTGPSRSAGPAIMGEWGASRRSAIMNRFGRERSPDVTHIADPPGTYPLDPAATGGGPGMSGHDEDLSAWLDPSVQTVGSVNIPDWAPAHPHRRQADQQWSGAGSDSDEVAVEPGMPGASEQSIVAAFQASAAARQFGSGGGAGGHGDSDIAKAAVNFLRTGEILTDAEAHELIAEGRGSRARNLDLLDLDGTHYAETAEAVKRRGLSLDDLDDDLVVM